MASREVVWTALRRVRALRFQARSEAGSGWNGVGQGTVAISEPAAGVVVHHEAGVWRQAGSGRVLRFANVFRWSAVGRSLRLEHLRLGPDNPVRLFDLTPAGAGAWRVTAPHKCRHDRYAASVVVCGRLLRVAWSVDGPRKRESIRYVYW